MPANARMEPCTSERSNSASGVSEKRAPLAREHTDAGAPQGVHAGAITTERSRRLGDAHSLPCPSKYDADR